MNLRERVSHELLPHVNQPGQYIGGEWNQAVHSGDWERAELRVVLGFPDTYAIGMSHLGLQILYGLCNQTAGVCAERVYAPWQDAEQVMRRRRIPLFTWDTRQRVSDAHIFAISLQYEMAFTNLLLLLDLADIPFRSRDRNECHPLIIVGGPQADNPEPVADFVDLVVLGDGEHSMAAILQAMLELRRGGATRKDMMVAMADRFEWIYAPSLYNVQYNADNTVARLVASSSCPSGFTPRPTIKRCRTPDLDRAPFPARPLVPFTETVHDRIAIEIMRGCPQLCRFCHAGYTKRPLHLRSVDRILEIAEEAWQATGYEEIGLLSLSSADYPCLHELATRINERFSDRHVSISLPSLRDDKMLANIPWMVNAVRKSGLTVAAEAARDDMRRAIRKKVTDGDLMDGIKAAFAAGWNSLKLYFMCGFPGETEDDIRGIFELARQVSLAKRQVRGGPAAVTASVSWLVPKPHTPLQWARMQTADYFKQARVLLRRTAQQTRSAVRVRTHHIERSLLEGVFARGDRRLAPVIERAYRLGARMDGWDERFNYGLWQQAFEETGVDPVFYAHRQRSFAETLPWSHLAGPLSPSFLMRQYGDFCSCLGIPVPASA